MRISDWSSDVCSSDLFRQVIQRLAKLLRFGGVLQGHATQNFRCKVRKASEAHIRLFAERIAHAQSAMIGNADDITRISLIRQLTVLGEEEDGTMDRDRFSMATQRQLHAPLERTGTEAPEGNPIPVLREIGRD